MRMLSLWMIVSLLHPGANASYWPEREPSIFYMTPASDGTLLGVYQKADGRYFLFSHTLKDSKTTFLVNDLDHIPTIVDGSTSRHLVWQTNAGFDSSQPPKPNEPFSETSYRDANTGEIRKLPKTIAGCYRKERVLPAQTSDVGQDSGTGRFAVSCVVRVFPEESMILCRHVDDVEGYSLYSLSDLQLRAEAKAIGEQGTPVGPTLLLGKGRILLPAKLAGPGEFAAGSDQGGLAVVDISAQRIVPHAPVPMPKNVYHLASTGTPSEFYAFLHGALGVRRVRLTEQDGRITANITLLKGYPFEQPGAGLPVGAWKDWVVWKNERPKSIDVWSSSTGACMQAGLNASLDWQPLAAAISESNGLLVCWSGSRFAVFEPADTGYRKLQEARIVE